MNMPLGHRVMVEEGLEQTMDALLCNCLNLE